MLQNSAFNRALYIVMLRVHYDGVSVVGNMRTLWAAPGRTGNRAAFAVPAGS
jgi:hypothetical protein